MYQNVSQNPGTADAGARSVVAKALARTIILSALTLAVSMPAGALTKKEEAGKQIYEQACLACHSIGQGPRVGPDLKDVNKRREHDWLVRWMLDPLNMIQSDPIAKKLLAEWNNVPMSDPNLDRGQIEQVLAYISAASGMAAVEAGEGKPVALADDEFKQAEQIYFDRCSGCHGVLRVGATGPNIQPKRTKQIGTQGIKLALTNGLPGGMPGWGRLGILSEYEIDLMARFIQLPPPTPPGRPLETIKASWKLMIPPEDRPNRPHTTRNWQNFIGVILRDVGQVGIVDGDSKEVAGVVDTGFAVHILRSSSTGRYFYAVGRDGRVSMIDLWTPEPTLVAQVQGCSDARSVDGSKYEGFEDKLVIEGCYWPPQYVVFDGQTLEPLKVQDVLLPTYDTNEKLKEVRVASIVASHNDPVWVITLKESGHVGIVDYSKDGFPMTSTIAAERFLHDGGWDHTQRYFLVAANMRNQIAVIDTKTNDLVAKFETGIKPHPGRGANWLDPEYGWVNGTTHIGEGKLTVYGADPAGSPKHAWKVVREIRLPSAGGLFLKTHQNSPWVWMDSPLSADENLTRQICVYSKEQGRLYRCWQPVDRGRITHFEYDMRGQEVWVSVWDKQGEIIVYDDKTLTEKQRLRGGWLVTPTGKFNAYNTANDVY
jgi:nitrite reductase (NO-forming)/hydroxylamine reductase